MVLDYNNYAHANILGSCSCGTGRCSGSMDRIPCNRYVYLCLRITDTTLTTDGHVGFASMTHYTLLLDFVAACGCVPASTHFPTAAMSQMAFGSSTAFGPSCGRCFNLTLLNTFLSDPPFYPNDTKSVVVKVTDLCPLGGSWCIATQGKPNQYV